VLAQTPYLAGDEITAADLAVYPIYAGRKALPDNAGLKHLQAWGERIGSRPSVQKGYEARRLTADLERVPGSRARIA
jgi:glutathione S-transferase